jgi:hypothetical protein
MALQKVILAIIHLQASERSDSRFPMALSQ